jgi:hypothetical protein
MIPFHRANSTFFFVGILMFMMMYSVFAPLDRNNSYISHGMGLSNFVGATFLFVPIMWNLEP